MDNEILNPGMFNKLRESTTTLNQLSNVAQAIIGEVEKSLEGVGTDAIVRLHEGDFTQPDYFEYAVAYQRHLSNFRIVLIIDDEPLAWQECTRAEKLRIFAALPSLITTLVERVQSQIESAQTALQSTDWDAILKSEPSTNKS